MITQTRLKELLNYDPITGIFTWKISRGGRNPGSIAGSRDTLRDYITIQIDGTLYRAHRLAFLYMLGRLPEDQVDHIDRCRYNNAWNNLRECTQAENQLNKYNNLKKRSGFTYIRARSNTQTWNVMIMKDKWIGSFKTLDAAIKALELALIETKDKKAITRFYKQLDEYKKKIS